MNEKDQFKLDAMSKLDDDVVDKTTELRGRLWRKMMERRKKKKTLVAILSSAASLFLMFGVVLVFLLLMKQVPVYTGMTVSNEFPTVSEEVARANPEDYVMIRAGGTSLRVTPMTALNQESLAEQTTGEETTEAETAPNVYAEETVYYARANEDIYITVHVDNPDNFVILQFTLNGKVYNSYMFEDGSDMENLILKYNVGALVGLSEYTLDNIKYIDDGEYKDVRLEGDTTVWVAIAPKEEDMPTVAFNYRSVGAKSLRVETSVKDPFGLLELVDAEVYGVVYKNNIRSEQNIIYKQKLAVGQNVVSYKQLDSQSLYGFYIVIEIKDDLPVYFSKEALGENWNVFGGFAFKTESLFSMDMTEVNGSTVSFKFEADKSAIKEIQKIELIDGKKTVVAALENVAVPNGLSEKMSFTNVPMGRYVFRFVYSYEEDGVTKTGEEILESVVTVLPRNQSLMTKGTVILEYSGEEPVFHAYTEDYRAHKGVDIVLGSDKTVYSAVSGEVVRINETSRGTVIDIIVVDNLKKETLFTLRYFGVDQCLVQKGDMVNAGTALGVITEGAKEGAAEPHLHLEMKVGSESYNPLDGYFYIPQ
ncbi:MAG: M23 family metallopeptidase [Clostridia bacterium]|nr:M23 family metallopeptidase [Clostridia bacterium]